MFFFVDFKKAFDSIHRMKMLKIRVYRISEKIVTATGILYKNIEAIVRTSDGDADFFFQS